MGLFDDLPEPELQARDAVLADLAERNAEILDWLRAQLVIIYRFRCADVGKEHAFVSADDARQILDADHRFDGRNRNFLGSLFQADGWQFTGNRIKSKTKGSHANELKTWRYMGN